MSSLYFGSSQLTAFFLLLSSRLIHRAFQTLWKPIPELVNILGLDIPPPPDVCLAGIRPNSAFLTWEARSSSQRPVQKLLIQVNGVDGA